MSVKRRDLVRHLEQNGFYLLREGANHSIYTNGSKLVPVRRHKQLDRYRQRNLRAGRHPAQVLTTRDRMREGVKSAHGTLESPTSGEGRKLALEIEHEQNQI